MNAYAATKQYQKVDTQSAIMEASPHQLVAMLISGAITRLSTAKGCIQRKDIAGKGEQIGSSMDIITGLQSSLDMEAGGDISVKLDSLYDYMIRRLMQASIDNDMGLVDEVIGLLREIKGGWDNIPAEYHYHSNQK
jgi:flagellar protein FliS